jgi:DNA-binding NarL/FixJ family response regulator
MAGLMVFRKLTDRQADVLWLICDGRSDQEIARELGILLGTARQYRYNILQRLGGAEMPDICREVQENPSALPASVRKRVASS